MKRLIVNLLLLLMVFTLGSCSIFKGGCKCPKVSYNVYPKR